MKKVIVFLTFLTFSYANLNKNETIFIVKENLADCTGLIKRKCILIKKKNSKKWEYFYDAIEGFKYQKGYRYELLVEVVKNKKVLQDGSVKKYKLIKILKKSKPKK
jgi:hypothetical protein